MAEIFLGIGSNVAAERHVELAVLALAARFGALEASRVYRNPAIGFAGDDFLNLVVRVSTALPPAQVHAELREIERAAARDRSEPRWGPRTLDIDLLVYGTLVDPTLRLPREDILRHAYVLCPIAEIAPDVVHPVSGQRFADIWRAHRGAVLPWTRGGANVKWPLPLGDGFVVQGDTLAVVE